MGRKGEPFKSKESWSKEGYSKGLLSYRIEAGKVGFTNLYVGVAKGNCDDVINAAKEEQLRLKVTETLQGYRRYKDKWWPYFSFVKDEFRYIEDILKNEDKFIAYIKEVFLLLKQSTTALIDDIINTGSIGKSLQ